MLIKGIFRLLLVWKSFVPLRMRRELFQNKSTSASAPATKKKKREPHMGKLTHQDENTGALANTGVRTQQSAACCLWACGLWTASQIPVSPNSLWEIRLAACPNKCNSSPHEKKQDRHTHTYTHTHAWWWKDITNCWSLTSCKSSWQVGSRGIYAWICPKSNATQQFHHF